MISTFDAIVHYHQCKCITSCNVGRMGDTYVQGSSQVTVIWVSDCVLNGPMPCIVGLLNGAVAYIFELLNSLCLYSCIMLLNS